MCCKVPPAGTATGRHACRSLAVLLGCLAVLIIPADAPSVTLVPAAAIGGGIPTDVVLSGDVLYVAAMTRLSVYHVEPDGSLTAAGGLSGVGMRRLQVHGSLAYAACGSMGVWILDVSSPSKPTQVGFLDTAGEVNALYVIHPLVYVADGPGGLLILDVNKPSTPRVVSACAVGNDARGVWVGGVYAYVACGEDGVAVVDVGDPTAPRVVHTIETPGTARWVTGNGSLLAVACGESGVHFLDISSPTKHRVVGFYPSPDVYSVVLQGTRAYVAEGTSGFSVLDISRPRNPAVAAVMRVPGSVVGVDLSLIHI